MYLGCEKYLPKTAYDLANKRLIKEIFKITGIKIDQILKEGWNMGIIEKGDVYAVIYDDNPYSLLQIAIPMIKTGRFQIEIGTDEETEKEGAGRLILLKEGIITREGKNLPQIKGFCEKCDHYSLCTKKNDENNPDLPDCRSMNGI